MRLDRDSGSRPWSENLYRIRMKVHGLTFFSERIGGYVAACAAMNRITKTDCDVIALERQDGPDDWTVV